VSGVVVVTRVALSVSSAGARAKTTDNGEAAKDAATTVADAQAATTGSPSVRISGTVVKDGQRTSLNIVSAHGSGGGVLFQNGQKFQLVVIPPAVYLKAPASTWTALSQGSAAGGLSAQLFGGKWVQTSTANSDFAGFADIFDVSKLMSQSDDPGTLTKGKITTFHGQRAIPIRSSNEPSTVYVAAAGRPFVLGVVGTGDSSGEVLFTDYGTAKLPRAPAHTIDLTTLEQTANGERS
jgi:hypothetical protein